MVAEVDPDDDLWPFSDTVQIFGRVGTDDLRDAVGPLLPDGVPGALRNRYAGPAQVVWWD